MLKTRRPKCSKLASGGATEPRFSFSIRVELRTQGHSICINQIDALLLNYCRSYATIHVINMITPPQLKAARALLGMDQRALAEASGLSLPTIQRMEASDGVIRGQVESLMKLIAALDKAGVELINEGAISEKGGRGVRLKPR